MIVKRNGDIIDGNNNQDKVLKILYGNMIGRSILKILTLPFITHLGGCFMNSSLSKSQINSFIVNNNINMEEYEDKDYSSYNDFFTRSIKDGIRDIDYNPYHLIAPCDCKISYYPIDNNLSLSIKDSIYSLKELLDDKDLANEYINGICLICRLTVDDYHHYHYIDDGVTLSYRYIPGIFHTVNPIANDYYPIYKQNSRAYSLLKTNNFGNVIYMEVGAMMVGKIVNRHLEIFNKGQEKGYFEFGGSTIVLLFKEKQVIIDQDIVEQSKLNNEIKVSLGEKIGVKL